MFCVNLKVTTGFPHGSDSKESNCNAGDLGFIPGLRRSPGGGHEKLLQHSCQEKSRGQGSLVGYSPWSCKESDMTEQLSTAHGNHKEEISIRHKKEREREKGIQIYHFKKKKKKTQKQIIKDDNKK